MDSRSYRRGDTIAFSFTFKDASGNTVDADSATLELTFPGRDDWETTSLTLSDTDDVWSVSWDSSVARAGWVEYHAHALDGSTNYVIDGRIRLTAGRASYQHDELPSGAGLRYPSPPDYQT